MLATFTAREDITSEFDIEGNNMPNELFQCLISGTLHAFRVDLVDGRLQITVSGDNLNDELSALLVAYADGPDSVEYHIAN